MLQGKLKLHSCCCEEQQQWHGADHCWPLVGSGGICAVSMVCVSTLPFFTGTQELLQLGLCPVLCHCVWGEDQKSPSSHFDGSQALCCAHKASGSKGWEAGMTEYFSSSFYWDCQAVQGEMSDPTQWVTAGWWSPFEPGRREAVLAALSEGRTSPQQSLHDLYLCNLMDPSIINHCQEHSWKCRLAFQIGTSD